MLKFVTRYDHYICKRCTEEFFCYQPQKTTDGVHYEDMGPLQNKPPQKCTFCGYTSFALASFHVDDHEDFGAHYTSDEYKADKVLFNSLQRQPEFDPKLREALIEKRRNKSPSKSIMSSTSTTTNTPKCPTCGSTHVHPISTGKKAAGFFIAGIFSSNFGKSYECDDCKYKW